MKTNEVPLDMYNATQTWINNNPDYNYEFYDDKRCIEFIKEYYDDNILTKFNVINTGAGKADFFRWLYLNKKGGVYLDIDTMCKVGLTESKLIKPKFDLVSMYSYTHKCRINHMILMSAPNTRLIKRSINKTLKNIDMLYHTRQNFQCTQDLCGPGVIYKCLNKMIGNNPDIPHTDYARRITVGGEIYIFYDREKDIKKCLDPKYESYNSDQEELRNTKYSKLLAFDYTKCKNYLDKEDIDIFGKKK